MLDDSAIVLMNDLPALIALETLEFSAIEATKVFTELRIDPAPNGTELNEAPPNIISLRWSSQ